MTKIKRVGLLSTQFTINYGAVLQAYSLYSNLKKNRNVDVLTINYAPKSARYGHFESYSFNGVKSSLISLFKIFNLGYRKSRKEKQNLFEDFVQSEFNLTEDIYLTNKELREARFDLDVAVVGSDQVWNPKVIDDSSFYLDFLPSNGKAKITSYAASLGSELTQGEMKELLCNLKRFDNISLREPIQLEELRRLSGKDVKVLVDPVFLTSRLEWQELANKSRLTISEPYILIYEVNSPPSFKHYVNKLKKLSDFNILEISTRPFSKYSGVKTISNAGPYDYLKLFANAQFILTSSFHGVAFSSIFNKNFSCVLNAERSTRQRHLLEHLGLKDCEVVSPSDLSITESEKNNWEDVNNSIARLTSSSFEYIDEIISNDT